MADDFKNIVVQGPEDRRPRRSLYLLLILLFVCVVAAIVLNRSERQDQQRAAQAPPPPPPRQPVLNLERQSFQAMRVLYGNKSLVEARAKGYDLLSKTKDPALQRSVEELLGQINTELIFAPAAMPEKEEYLVQPGDSLERIAKKFKTTVELIKKSNALESAMLHPGDRLLIFNGAFSLAISKSRNELALSVNNRFFKRYRIGTGKFGSTPTGTFVIGEKIEEPAWWRPDGQMIPYGDKENILGTHWMTLTATGTTPAVRGYGLHGTWAEETIGQQASAGCVRLLNSEVEELFTLLPMGTPVVIAE